MKKQTKEQTKDIIEIVQHKTIEEIQIDGAFDDILNKYLPTGRQA
jgi:hypothetical protein